MDEKYFVAKVTTDSADAETGKVKKIREEQLVKAFSPTDVEAKISKKVYNFFMILILLL